MIGADAATDLAVIRVEGKTGLASAKIGNSDAVQVGDWAIAIGSPFGFQATVTAGIISAKERDIPGESIAVPAFPADRCGHQSRQQRRTAAEHPRRSDRHQHRDRLPHRAASRASALPCPSTPRPGVYNDIIKTGKVTRGSIGITFTPTDTEQAPALLKAYGANEGVFVQQVAPGGPADKAGMKDGDIIVAINGKPVREGNELVGTVTSTPVGNSLNITVIREKKRSDYKVVVGDLAQLFPDKFGGGSEAAPDNAARRRGQLRHVCADAYRAPAAAP